MYETNCVCANENHELKKEFRRIKFGIWKDKKKYVKTPLLFANSSTKIEVPKKKRFLKKMFLLAKVRKYEIEIS